MQLPEYELEVKKFLTNLKYKELDSTTKIALASIKLIEKLINESKWQTSSDLLKILKEEGNNLFKLINSDATILKNIWKRVIKIIKDESLNQEQSTHAQFDSLQGNLFISLKSQTFELSETEFQPIMFEAISEIRNEIETGIRNIASQSPEHIHENEVILTLGKSDTVEEFLKYAAKKRKFHVIIAESQPYLKGHDLAANLAKCGLDVTLIPDSAIFTIISRVNTVIIGTKAIFANGGLKANAGTHSLALAAKHHNIPFIVLAPLIKLSTEFCVDSNNLPDLLPSDDVLSIGFHPNITVINPSFDYVPPELVNLFIFNTTKNAPSYVYRILREVYETEED